MPKAKKLPSGSYRCRVTWTETVDGKKVRRSKSFTSDDKQVAERAASNFDYKKKDSHVPDLTVGDALDAFIEMRAASLSPSTLRGYKSSRKNSYECLEAVSVAAVDDRAVQAWVDEFKVGRSAKTVKNNYTLLQSALTMARPSLQLHVVLPESAPVDYITPSDEDIKRLLKAFKGTDMEKAVLLAAFGSLRRSEICALTRADINKNTVTVRQAVVTDGSGWIQKGTKTATSTRTVQLPAKVIKKLLRGTTNPQDKIVNLNPGQITDKFIKTIKAEKLPHFRFHDLRAYSASMRHALGIPDQYIMMDGGWKTDTILKRVYRRALEDKRKEFAKVSNDHFASLVK